ncbi:hypothetical protein R3P38DRAFT_1038088 [Favolaschia claudopus]|uniref:Uncharacterized protein n=1 Tax=Favolaschia claudopus TaxID=2862362 RepID=A0AAW0BIN2_9AGAR
MFSLTHLLGLLVHPMLQLSQAASLTPTNITIDDTNTTYFSFDQGPVVLENPFWVPASVSNPCGYCSAQPGIVSPPDSIFNQTWHDGKSGATGTLRFQGSAVYIYGIDILSSANMSFSLDSDTPVYHHYDGLNQFVFRSLFFSAEGLKADVPHTLSWILNTPNTNGTASGLFDYAVVTVDGGNVSTVTDPGSGPSSTPPTASSSGGTAKSKVAPIVGGVVGGITGVALIVLIAILIMRRRRTRVRISGATEPGRSGTVQPFVAAPEVGQSGSKTMDMPFVNPSGNAPSMSIGNTDRSDAGYTESLPPPYR